MLSRNEYYVEILEYPKEQLFSIINKTTAYLLHEIMDETDDKDLPYDCVIDLVFMYTFHDGFVSEDKKYIIKDVFDLEMDSDEEYLEFAKFRDENAEIREKFLNKMRKDDDFNDAEFLLAISIYALDGEITKEEQVLVEKNTRQNIIKNKAKGTA